MPQINLPIALARSRFPVTKPIEGRHETSSRHDAAASALIFDREGRDAIEKAE
jgi:hypothetical protein